MAQGISEALTYAIGVAISALAIIAVILMLVPSRAVADRVRCAFPAPGRAQLAQPAGTGSCYGDAEVDGGYRLVRAGKALGLGLLLAGANPKNLLLEVGAGSALAVR